MSFVASASGPPEFAVSLPELVTFHLQRSMDTPLDKLVPLTGAQLDTLLERGIHPMMFSFSYSVTKLLEVQERMGVCAPAYPHLPIILPMLTDHIRALGGFQQQVCA